MDKQLGLVSRYGMRTEVFSDLMASRVQEILLVASQYDAFILEEDGQLTELVSREYRNLDLNLRFAPRFTLAKTGEDAFKLLADRKFDLVITTPRLGDIDLEGFGRTVKVEFGGVPVAVLAAHAWDLPRLAGVRESGSIDWVFLWQGDVTVLLALIKQVEDRQNADHDILQGGVQAIILVEDEVAFFSSFLAQIYTEVTLQTGLLMAEGLNLSHRLLRIRARPKILLAQSYSEAWDLYERYAENVLGVVSDVRFSLDDKEDAEAGVKLAKRIRENDADLPILLLSTESENVEKAHAAGAHFLRKDSPRLLEGMRDYMMEHFGFGDFVFRTPDGIEVGRADNIRAMVDLLERIPDESIEYHASRNHFSRWLKARSEFELASILKPRRVSEFSGIQEIREHLIGSLVHYLRAIRRHIITDFDSERYDGFVALAKIGDGSLGGKGRGLAFMHKLLAQESVDIEKVDVVIPETVVVASDVFDEFMTENGLRPEALEPGDNGDQELLDSFRRARFNSLRRGQFAAILNTIDQPLAVRSSSILEDSLFQPFAGVYVTVMIPNSHPSLDVRLAQLIEAIKVVYASTYFKGAREYLAATPYRPEEERMAVLIQRLVGSRHDDKFYPVLSGVASSFNFYPVGGMKHEDGVALVAMGLGKTVVEGRDALRFCPTHPEVLPQFSSVKDILHTAQRKFFALDMNQEGIIPGLDPDINLLWLDTIDGVKDGAADQIVSTYRPENDTVVTGRMKNGTPLVTFSGLLQGYVFPLPRVIDRLLKISEKGFGMPVEIEFALDLKSGQSTEQVFHVLQVRPMVVERIDESIDLSGLIRADNVIATSDTALGHGRASVIRDIVAVDPEKLDRSQTKAIAEILEGINSSLRSEGRWHLLIGPGRWGSNDSWLGIPVAWQQISTARAIIEVDFKDMEVEPSQGSHFFHNITNFGISYFTVHDRREQGSVNWEWLNSQSAVKEYLDGVVRHIRLDDPVHVLVEGRSGKGAVLLSNQQPVPEA